MPKNRSFDDDDQNDFDGADWENLTAPSISHELAQHYAEEDATDGYIEDWESIALAYKQSMGFECENCNASFLKHRRLLHVHHRDKDKSNNDRSNLMALCVLCHADYHEHMQAKISDDVRATIIDLRKRNL
jgi:5-methylcytosine-specific restriction endonuclease McrA